MSENNNLFDVSPTTTAVGGVSHTRRRATTKRGNGRGWGSASMMGDPRFVDEFGFNFHLQSSSPAIDKGDTEQAPL
jgi:hypothetical protein